MHVAQDGYGRDEAGIHYRALNAILETTPGRDCYGFIGARRSLAVTLIDPALCGFHPKGMAPARPVDCLEQHGGSRGGAMLMWAWTSRSEYTKHFEAGLRCASQSADVYEDRLDFIGVDNLDSMEMPFAQQAAELHPAGK